MFKSMVLWNFDLLWKKLGYYTENNGTSIYVGKNIVDYQNTKKLLLIMKKI